VGLLALLFVGAGIVGFVLAAAAMAIGALR
jgi:hypothetical protein